MRSVSHGRDVTPDNQHKLARSASHGHHPVTEVASHAAVTDHVNKHATTGAKLISVRSGEAKLDRHSHSGKNGRPKKGENRIKAKKLM